MIVLSFKEFLVSDLLSGLKKMELMCHLFIFLYTCPEVYSIIVKKFIILIFFS